MLMISWDYFFPNNFFPNIDDFYEINQMISFLIEHLQWLNFGCQLVPSVIIQYWFPMSKMLNASVAVLHSKMQLFWHIQSTTQHQRMKPSPSLLRNQRGSSIHPKMMPKRCPFKLDYCKEINEFKFNSPNLALG